MEEYKCKLCTRSFISGRALGGHMKAHLAILPHHHRTPPSSYSDENLSDPKFSFSTKTEYILHDRESETESKHPTQKRSNRNRNSEQKKLKQSLIASHSPQTPISSISETSPEEELAKTLMMLSRDQWNTDVAVKEESQEVERSMEDIKFREVSRRRKCYECGQNFPSSTAVKSHKNICLQNEPATTSGGDHKIFKCLVCSKVFGSGQALGGHKKSHLHKKKLCFIDLNLPPSLQENHDRIN
ncbi:unnamed protein product [Vicia faba]|uniref:C2H2-type domain-containing protein n=1 Tax=Vicia faba TaxID=3906 RepID=A0AAV0YW25_VICFA|nr:unnamed protein product [Vicia faba]